MLIPQKYENQQEFIIMENWLVRLKGEEFDLEILPPLLHSTKLSIIKENNSYYLKSSDFDSLKSADEVRESAIAIIKRLNGTMMLFNHNFHSISEDGVLLVEKNGKRCFHLYLEGSIKMRSRVSANFKATTPNGIQQIDPQYSTVESWINLAKSDKIIADALHFFKKGTWISFYKVYEIIKDDIGSQQAIIKSGFVKKQKLKRFTQTAQSSLALGDEARHASKKCKPPAKPMTFDEAKSFIREFIISWFCFRNKK